MENKSIEILLVEDNPGDVRLTLEALRDSRIANRVTVAQDGAEALEIVRGRGPTGSEPRPDLILLDLNLPKVNGFEVLEKLKNDDACRRIPIIVFTSSKAEQDILKTYNLHANSFVTKPIDFEQFANVVRSIENFWFVVVQLPPK